jgi:hypothetical protein
MADDILDKLREAKAPWQKDGLGLRGSPAALSPGISQAISPKGRYDFKITETPVQPNFPERPEVVSASSPPGGAAGQPLSVSFGLSLDTVDNDAGTVSIIIDYGEINLEPPEDMDPDTDFTFDLVTPGSEIWAEVTYDPDTLVIDGRTLEFGATLPDSLHELTVDGGIVRFPIGYVDWEYDDDGNITGVSPHNRLVGDINFQLIVGANNSTPAILPVIAGEWAAIPSE